MKTHPNKQRVVVPWVPVHVRSKLLCNRWRVWKGKNTCLPCLAFWRSSSSSLEMSETADLAPVDAAGEPFALVAHNLAQFVLQSCSQVTPKLGTTCNWTSASAIAGEALLELREGLLRQASIFQPDRAPTSPRYFRQILYTYLYVLLLSVRKCFHEN